MRASVVATCLGLALCGSATAQEITVWTMGIGHLSCANWLSNDISEQAGNSWVLGFWSGLNVFNTDHTVGHSIDNLGKLGELKKTCVEHPSASLSTVAREIYDMFAAQHR
jgi:hypothetical protein